MYWLNKNFKFYIVQDTLGLTKNLFGLDEDCIQLGYLARGWKMSRCPTVDCHKPISIDQNLKNHTDLNVLNKTNVRL